MCWSPMRAKSAYVLNFDYRYDDLEQSTSDETGQSDIDDADDERSYSSE